MAKESNNDSVYGNSFEAALLSDFETLESALECAREGLNTLRVAVNDKQPDPGAVAFVDRTLQKIDAILGNEKDQKAPREK